MDLGLSNKVAFVAGASRGLGKAIAYELAREGASVAICSRSEANITQAATEIANDTGAHILPLVADVTNAEQIEEAITATVRQWEALHILVVNGGGAPAGRFEDLDDISWHQALELNFMSAVRLIRSSLLHMRQAGWGRIITVTSTTVKQPIDDLLLSNGVRPGVVGIVRSLATQLAAEGITINNVAPGYTLTERVNDIVQSRAASAGISEEEVMQSLTASMPTGRMGTPEELAAVVAFLASTRASYMNGQTILVDGGTYRGLI